jgi:cysteine desulfurase family protein (TIGR01976 family)
VNPRSLTELRADFPALSSGLAYFDGPGGTQVPEVVIDAIREHLVERNGNTHWNSPTSRATDASVVDAREVFAAFLNGRPDEIVFGANMTTLTLHLARGLGQEWQAGDEVVVTELDHHANLAPWQALERERGIVLRWLPMDIETGTLRLDQLPSLLNSRTRLVAVGGASNALGTINDIAAISSHAHAAGALLFVDAVHLAPHRLPDVAAWGADFMACSPYKFYGPHLGVLWGKHELLQAVAVPKLLPAPDTAPDRLETGTQSFEAIAGATAAVRWLAGIGGADGSLREQLTASFAELHRRETELFATLWAGLADLPGITPLGPKPGAERTGTVSCRVTPNGADEIAAELADRGVAVSHGDFYASTAVAKMGGGSAGFLRIGLAAYTSPADVDQLLMSLKR